MADELPNTPVPEPTPAPATSAPEAVVTTSVPSAELLTRAEALGLDKGTFTSDRDLAAAMFDLYEQHKPYVDYGRQALASNPLRQAPEQQPEPEPAEAAFDLDRHFNEAWKVPELSPGAQWAMQHGAVIENDKGILVAAPGLEQIALPHLREIQDHQQARAALSEEFNRNPVRFMYDKLIDALRHELRTDFEELDRETKTKSQVEQFEQRFSDENKDWLFTADGQLSPAGFKFRQQVDHWRAKGVTDPEALAQLAMAAAKPAAAPVAPGTAEPAPTKSGNGQPRAADGTFAPRQSAFLENAKRQSAAGGGRSDPSVEDYKPANRGELGNIWMEAFQKQRAGAA